IEIDLLLVLAALGLVRRRGGAQRLLREHLGRARDDAGLLGGERFGQDRGRAGDLVVLLDQLDRGFARADVGGGRALEEGREARADDRAAADHVDGRARADASERRRRRDVAPGERLVAVIRAGEDLRGATTKQRDAAEDLRRRSGRRRERREIGER